MKGTLEVKTLRVPVKIGCTAEEKGHPQLLDLDIQMQVDVQQCLASDSLEDVVDYLIVAEVVLANAAGRSWNLVESFAHDIGRAILAKFHRVESVQVTAYKKVLAQCEYFSVSIKIDR